MHDVPRCAGQAGRRAVLHGRARGVVLADENALEEVPVAHVEGVVEPQLLRHLVHLLRGAAGAAGALGDGAGGDAEDDVDDHRDGEQGDHGAGGAAQEESSEAVHATAPFPPAVSASARA